jgi:hypothetical protein
MFCHLLNIHVSTVYSLLKTSPMTWKHIPFTTFTSVIKCVIKIHMQNPWDSPLLQMRFRFGLKINITVNKDIICADWTGYNCWKHSCHGVSCSAVCANPVKWESITTVLVKEGEVTQHSLHHQLEDIVALVAKLIFHSLAQYTPFCDALTDFWTVLSLNPLSYNCQFSETIKSS